MSAIRNPNFILAVRVNDQALLSKLQSVQECITKKSPLLTSAAVPLQSSTILLNSLFLNKEEVEKAETLLKGCHGQIKELLKNKTLCLTFQGISKFKNQVLFAKLVDDEGFKMLKRIKELFSGIFSNYEVPKNHKLIMPLLKLSKISPKNRPKNLSHLVEESLKEELFGVENVTALHLLSLNNNKVQERHRSRFELNFFDENVVENIADDYKDKQVPNENESKQKALEDNTMQEKKGEDKSNGDDYSEKAPRVNFFLALQIRNSEILDHLRKVQSEVLAKKPKLKAASVGIEKTHITLSVFHLKDEDINRAREILMESCEEIRSSSLLEKPFQLTVSGMGCFRNEVVFADVRKDENFDQLKTLQEFMAGKFEEFITPEHREYNPHLTLFKLTGKSRRQKIRKIPKEVYEEFWDDMFGVEIFSTVQLLSMVGEKDENGYYKSYGEFSLFNEMNAYNTTDNGEGQQASDENFDGDTEKSNDQTLKG